MKWMNSTRPWWNGWRGTLEARQRYFQPRPVHQVPTASRRHCGSVPIVVARTSSEMRVSSRSVWRVGAWPVRRRLHQRPYPWTVATETRWSNAQKSRTGGSDVGAPVLAAAASVTFVDCRKQPARPSTPSSTPCGNCGRCGHPSRSADCPACGKKCDQCGKDGHLRSVCRSAGSSKGKSSSKNGTVDGSRQRSYSRPANYVDEANSVADGIQSVTIGTVQTSELLRWLIVIYMASASVCFWTWAPRSPSWTIRSISMRERLIHHFNHRLLRYVLTVEAVSPAQRAAEWCSYPWFPVLRHQTWHL